MPQDYISVLEESRGQGFNFDNVLRNEMLAAKGVKLENATKSGTTICGLVCKDGVVLAADTRATAGPVVADKFCDKVHPITHNIFCAGAGTAADLEHTTELLSAQCNLDYLSTGKMIRTRSVMRQLSKKLFGYQGYIGCALVLGGVDPIDGPSIYQIYPHGSTDSLPFTAMGSGSLNAMAVLEAGYKDNMSVEEAEDLCARAILSGVMNDLGSGSQVDVTSITKQLDSEGNFNGKIVANKQRPFSRLQPPLPKRAQPTKKYPKGMTAIAQNVDGSLMDNWRQFVTIVENDMADVEMVEA